MRTYIVVYLGAALGAIALAPLIIRLAWRLRVLDTPGLRKIHSSPTPRLGGMVLAVPILGVTAAVYLLDNTIGQAFRAIQLQVVALGVGALLVLLLGAIDDVRGLGPKTKFTFQIAVAAFVCACGIRIELIALKGVFSVHLGVFGWPVTILWIVGMMNAVNLIDGLDGLAAGISAIAFAVVGLFALYVGLSVMAVLMLACVGALNGFLLFNYNPAKIFLGDCGTYLLGFILGAGSILCAAKTHAIVGLALPFIAMGVPIFDTLFSMLRRALERRPVFSPDRGHVHHRLIAMGLHQRQTVIALYSLTLIIAGLAMFMMIVRDVGVIAVFISLVVLLILAFRLSGAVRLRQTLRAVRRNRSIGQAIRTERAAFCHADLALQETECLDSWWNGLCLAADSLGLARFAMTLQNRDGTSRVFHWERGDAGTDNSEVSHFCLRIPDRRMGARALVEGDVRINGSIEGAGRRAALLFRLLERHGLVTVQKSSRSRPEPAVRPSLRAHM